jgi:hypothetical protein
MRGSALPALTALGMRTIAVRPRMEAATVAARAQVGRIASRIVERIVRLLT